MNKHFLTGVALLVLGGLLAGCTHDDVDYSSIVDGKVKAYQEVFVDAYGKIDPNQTWGFTQGQTADSRTTASIAVNLNYDETYTVRVFANDPLADNTSMVLAKGTVTSGGTFTQTFSHNPAQHSFMVGVTSAKGFTSYKQVPVADGRLETAFGSTTVTRSITSPQVDDISIPTDSYAKSFLTGASEVDDDNVTTEGNRGASYDAGSGWYEEAPHYTVNYKITSDWEGTIAPMANAGHVWTGEWEDGAPKYDIVPRTVYVSAKWTIPADTEQRVGQQANELTGTSVDGIVVVDSGGEIEVNGLLNFVNCGRLVVMPGGRITGMGKVQVTNGNVTGCEGYNGGTIDVGTFNNNFGRFHNYGTFKCTLLQGGAQESNFYNHGVTHIVRSGVAESWGGNYDTPNTRVFNNCQFYCDEDMRLYVLENAPGSYFYVGGELMMSDGNDGTSTNSYVALGNGSLVRVGTLWNNNSSWVGPTVGTAVVELGGINYLNVTGNNPVTQGYFINNLAISVEDKTLTDRGGNNYSKLKGWYLNGYGHDEYWVTDYDLHAPTGAGNGNAVIVEKGGADIVIPASTGFVAGTAGCSPGYNGTPADPEEIDIPIDQGEEVENRITVVTTREYYETTELTEQGRVFCEDLGQISSNDLDFNDVVFDAYVYRTTPSTRTIVTENGVTVSDETVEGTPSYKTTIILLAAGGTLQLSLAGEEVHNVLGNNPTSTIINTITSVDGSYGNNFFTHDPVVMGTDFAYQNIVSIPIVVNYGNGETLTLEATQGWAPHKILVPIGTKWVKERVDIATAYTDFHNYVGTSQNFWDGNKETGKLYYHEKDTYQPRSKVATRKLVSTEGPTTTYRSAGTTTATGGYQGEDVLSRRGSNF